MDHTRTPNMRLRGMDDSSVSLVSICLFIPNLYFLYHFSCHNGWSILMILNLIFSFSDLFIFWFPFSISHIGILWPVRWSGCFHQILNLILIFFNIHIQGRACWTAAHCGYYWIPMNAKKHNQMPRNTIKYHWIQHDHDYDSQFLASHLIIQILLFYYPIMDSISLYPIILLWIPHPIIRILRRVRWTAARYQWWAMIMVRPSCCQFEGQR